MFTDYFEIEQGVRLFFKVYSSVKDNEQKICSDQPTLIFLHGGPGVVDHTLYEPFWSKFAGKEIMNSKLQIIFIDQRGCGRSFYNIKGISDYGPTSTWNLKQWGKDVHAFFRAFNINEPILAGVSFGGVVAISCATQFPKELGGLILSDTDAHFDLDHVLRSFATRVKNKGGDLDEIDRVCTAAKNIFTETSLETYSMYVRTCIPYCATNPYNPDLIARCIKNEKVAFLYNRNELTKFNFLPDLNKVECQILVISGDQSPVHTSESAKRTAAAIQSDKLNFKIFSGAGSPVYRDRDEEVTLILNEFLDKLSIQFLNKTR